MTTGCLHPRACVPAHAPVGRCRSRSTVAGPSAGTFTRVARPSLWPWLVAGLVALGALAAFAHAVPRRRAETAATVAGVAAAGALAASTAFATGDMGARRAQ